MKSSLQTEREPQVRCDALDMPLVARFQRIRWSETRRSMDGMKPGEKLILPESEYYNAHASAARLNDAYAGTRRWETRRKPGAVEVRHIDASATSVA